MIHWFIYAVSFSLIWLLSWLPSRILYIFSDLCAFLLWYVFPYRKKVILKNLALSFPEKKPEEHRKIAKRFYHHFCDTFMEAMSAIHMNKEKFNRRYRFLNIDYLNDLYASGKDIILVLGHYANWEWLSLLPLHTEYTILAIYKTLHNKFFDRMFIRLRGKFGVVPVPKEKALRIIIEYQKKRDPIITYFLADQRPRWNEIQYWTTFMNQPTPVILGPEKIAPKLDMVVLFFHIKRVRRGFYESTFVPLVMEPANIESYEITRKYYQNLEKMIRENPEFYLWSHDRWKHTKKYEQSLKS
ncbi:MAG: hypothetical protein AMS27_03590 [Bacteroides sp. SM23_62_1]|nr:MAG: hypothetical protein AMS27_03590 [Bacteroides sp. SM23_62_1]